MDSGDYARPSTLGWLAIGALAAVGCMNGGHDEIADPPVTVSAAALQRVASCAEAESLIRARALASMNAKIDSLKKQQPSSFQGCPDAGAYDAPASGAAPSSNSAPSTPPSSARASAEPSASSDAAKAVSTTNNQDLRVDEADFIKNDSRYVYAALNGALRIIQAWPASIAQNIMRVQNIGALGSDVVAVELNR